MSDLSSGTTGRERGHRLPGAGRVGRPASSAISTQLRQDAEGRVPTTGNTGFQLSQRRMLLTSAAMSAGACVTFPQAVSREVEGRRTVSFNAGWRFWRGDLPGAQSPTLNDSGWRELDLPHDVSIEDAPGAPPTSDPWVDGAFRAPSMRKRWRYARAPRSQDVQPCGWRVRAFSPLQ